MSVILNPNGPWEAFIIGLQDHNQAYDVYGYLSSRNPWGLGSKALFEHYLKVLIFFNTSGWYPKETATMVYGYFTNDSRKEAKTIYGYNNREYKNLLLTLLEGTDGNIPNGLIRELLMVNLESVQSGPDASIISHDEVLKVAKSNFRKILAAENNSGVKVYNTFLSCIDKVEEGTHKVIIDPDTCILMRERIGTHPYEYFSSFVRLLLVSSNPEYNSITCEPFWEQIFRDKSIIRALIVNPKTEIGNRAMIQNFWKLYEANGLQPISFENDGDVQHKIDSGLVLESRKFDNAMNIGRKFDTLKSKYYGKEVSKQVYNKELSNLREQIDKINLNIRRINLLRVEMVNEIEQLQD